MGYLRAQQRKTRHKSSRSKDKKHIGAKGEHKWPKTNGEQRVHKHHKSEIKKQQRISYFSRGIKNEKKRA